VGECVLGVLLLCTAVERMVEGVVRALVQWGTEVSWKWEMVNGK